MTSPDPRGELGIVLKTAPLRESDLIVTLYTESHGRLSAVARGARRSQRRFAGALQLLVLGRHRLARGRGELWTLDGTDIEREWTRLATDVVAVAHASYAAELVATLVPPEVPDPEVLSLVVALWDSLAEAGPSPGALRAVELALLDLGGHRPALDACAACGRADLEAGVVFDPSRGGAICRSCAAGSRGPGIRPLDPAALAYLRAVAALATPAAARSVDTDPRFTPSDRTAARDALLAMIGLLVGKPLRSLEFIAKLGAAGRRDEP
ncbi:MAG: DNA repair protein RecO [Myxococcales bacterium]|nr:DNA repair protein RecO [Myxococcales bacterium]